MVYAGLQHSTIKTGIQPVTWVPFPKSRAFQRPATVALIGQIQPARPEFKGLISGLES